MIQGRPLLQVRQAPRCLGPAGPPPLSQTRPGAAPLVLTGDEKLELAREGGDLPRRGQLARAPGAGAR